MGLLREAIFQQGINIQSKPQLYLDGTNILEELYGVSKELPGYLGKRRPIFYYCNSNLMAIRIGDYKIHYKTSPIFLNDTVDPNLSYFCPNGKPRADWYVSASCPDEHLTTHDPPSVFDLAKDPYERYALEESDFVKQMRSQGANIVKEHRQTLVPVPIQMGHFDKNVVPCCDPPACRCDKITRREKANEEPSLHYPSVYKFFEGIGGIKGGI
ncbi:hypothetical protein Y032_0106g3741 [Ancylostoma ceylanicum]|uniref:Sulfatase N-terminal domain-containing protein n=1 Tax=Ancylostoma ceylanicum TaxID=53326 RepID=A0A016TG23_9BILA|nr:hypothetical protein Y032_0106g3741 [Ancylostoma ceylanicum]